MNILPDDALADRIMINKSIKPIKKSIVISTYYHMVNDNLAFCCIYGEKEITEEYLADTVNLSDQGKNIKIQPCNRCKDNFNKSLCILCKVYTWHITDDKSVIKCYKCNTDFTIESKLTLVSIITNRNNEYTIDILNELKSQNQYLSLKLTNIDKKLDKHKAYMREYNSAFMDIVSPVTKISSITLAMLTVTIIIVAFIYLFSII